MKHTGPPPLLPAQLQDWIAAALGTITMATLISGATGGIVAEEPQEPKNVQTRPNPDKEASLRMETEGAKLAEEYPNQWAAIGKEGLIAHAESVEDLLEDLVKHGLQSYEYNLTYLDPDTPRYMLL